MTPARRSGSARSAFFGGFSAVTGDAERHEVLGRVRAAFSARNDVKRAEQESRAALDARTVALDDHERELPARRVLYGLVRSRVVWQIRQRDLPASRPQSRHGRSASDPSQELNGRRLVGVPVEGHASTLQSHALP
jgi:hypothetical protein